MSRIGAFAFSLFLAFGAVVAPASAMQTETNVQRVSFADLNLNSQAGATVMISRIHNAARIACGDRHGVMTLAERRAIRTCRTTAEQNAVAELNHPTVTAMYYGREPTVIFASN